MPSINTVTRRFSNYIGNLERPLMSKDFNLGKMEKVLNERGMSNVVIGDHLEFSLKSGDKCHWIFNGQGPEAILKKVIYGRFEGKEYSEIPCRLIGKREKDTIDLFPALQITKCAEFIGGEPYEIVKIHHDKLDLSGNVCRDFVPDQRIESEYWAPLAPFVPATKTEILSHKTLGGSPANTNFYGNSIFNRQVNAKK